MTSSIARDRQRRRIRVRVGLAQSNTYKRFALLWIPPQRRLLKPLKVRAVQG
jgi:hypothetical protein